MDSAKKRVGIGEDNVCPFCSRIQSTKTRVFAMDAGRHMEEAALAVPPRDSEYEDDQGSAGSFIDPSSPEERLAHPPKDGTPPFIEGLEESEFSDYDAQMFCALKLYVLDSTGQHLSHQIICDAVGVTPKDQNGNVIPSDVIIPYTEKHRPSVYSDVTAGLKEYWESKAKEIYAQWLKRTLARNHLSHQPEEPTEERPGSSEIPLFGDEGHWAAGSRIGLEDFDILATIGKGTSSKIMLAEKKSSKGLFALKVIKKELIVEQDELSNVRVEKNVLLKATQEKHPFIVHLQASFQTETRLYFVMEYVSGGDLMFHAQRGPFGTEKAQFYAAEVCLALKWFHERHILLRDVKLDNIMLGIDGHIKIVGFGFCKESMLHGTKTRTFCGTAEFMAPEILLDKEYGLPVDWWGFGVIVYQMLLQQSPFRGENEDQIYDAILASEPSYPIHMPRDSVSIVQKLLVREPEQRLGSGPEDALEVMRHAFFKGINWDDLYNKRTRAPFLPQTNSPRDTSNFDSEYTSITPALTPVQSVLTEAMQEEFKGFSVIVPP